MTSKEVFEFVLSVEIEALQRVKSRFSDHFERTIDLIIQSKSRVSIFGIGKSGIIGKKIASTMSSTGTPSICIHPTDALHGDIGMLQSGDVAFLISNSGKTRELLELIPHLKLRKVKIVAFCGNKESPLVKNADLFLDVSVEREACTLELAPTASTTAALVMGDAVSIALMTAKNFKKLDFAAVHPFGALGRKLLTKVEDEMLAEAIPNVMEFDSVKKVIATITSGLIGLAVVLDSANKVIGLITDGDLSRALLKFNDHSFFKINASEIMTKEPRTIGRDLFITSAEDIMNKQNINSLIVVDKGILVGVLLQRKIKYGVNSYE